MSQPDYPVTGLPTPDPGYDILHAVNGAVSRVKRIEDSRTSQISDLLSGGIL
jgi:hypothetical protein